MLEENLIIVSVIGIIVGGFNWLSIGLLQYDFIAGAFGTQASILSRLVYIAIGVCTAFVCFDLIKNKGKILLFNRRKKQEPQVQYVQPQQPTSNMQQQKPQSSETNIDILS